MRTRSQDLALSPTVRVVPAVQSKVRRNPLKKEGMVECKKKLCLIALIGEVAWFNG